MNVVRYTSEKQTAWDAFVRSSKNGTFLLERDFMDYHAHRFADHSLLILNDRQKIVAVLPANERDGALYSHEGLTYGGLVLPFNVKINTVIACWKAVSAYCARNAFTEIYYKAIPEFYHQQPALDDQYALFLLGAQLYRMDTSFVVSHHRPLALQQRRNRAITKARKLCIEIRQDTDFRAFWEEILEPNLRNRFGVKPVHSLEEIALLGRRFPKQILQYNAYLDGKIVAGTTLFRLPTAVHAQYISANDQGRRSGAIDLLFFHLITKEFVAIPFFSFGIANEQQGLRLNQGLTDWKEGYGTIVFPHAFYKIPTESHTLRF